MGGCSWRGDWGVVVAIGRTNLEAVCCVRTMVASCMCSISTMKMAEWTKRNAVRPGNGVDIIVSNRHQRDS